jgi:hypothetical protein
VQGVRAPARAAANRTIPSGNRCIQILTILGFALPVAIYLWYLHHYSLNVVWGDQWNDVSLIAASYNGHLTLSRLWAQFNENRLLFPNLIVLGLSRLTAFNVTVEEYISAIFLFGAITLIICAHKRRSPMTPLLAYCPVVILMLSLVQGGNTLSGFQLAWYLVLVALTGVIFVLDRKDLATHSLVFAILLAIVGSFSSVQGLLIWIAGLLLMYYRRRSAAQMAVWVGSALATAGIYFYNYSRNTTPASLSAYARFYFQLVGDVLGVPLTSNGFETQFAFAFGILIVALALYSFWSLGRHRDTESAVPLGLALTAYGLLFALITTYSRAAFGPVSAEASRYTTYDLLIVVGTYLTYASNPSPWRTQTATRPSLRTVLLFLLGAVITAQAVFGFDNGILGARQTHQAVLAVAVATTDVRHLPDQVVQEELYPENPGFSVDALRSDARVLVDHGLSFYSDKQSVLGYSEQAAVLTRQGVFKHLSALLQPSTLIDIPHDGSTLRGRTLLLAFVHHDPDLQRVDFVLTDATGTRTIGSARHSIYGWFIFWKSSTVPNGDYQLTSEAIDGNGHVTSGAPVRITVSN